LVFLSQVERLYQGLEATTSSIVDRFAHKEIDAYKHNAKLTCRKRVPQARGCGQVK
jgi:hypothetical protein